MLSQPLQAEANIWLLGLTLPDSSWKQTFYTKSGCLHITNPLSMGTKGFMAFALFAGNRLHWLGQCQSFGWCGLWILPANKITVFARLPTSNWDSSWGIPGGLLFFPEYIVAFVHLVSGLTNKAWSGMVFISLPSLLQPNRRSPSKALPF